MNNPRRGFFFRFRSWLLLPLFAVSTYSLLFTRVRVGSILAHLLSMHVGEIGRGFWLHATYGLAAALAGLGVFWRTWGSAYLGTKAVQDKELHADRSVGDGPFRRTRNPLYFGNMLMILGLGIMVGALPSLIVVVGMWILLRLFIHDEEAGLAEMQGEPYRAYRAAVPGMLPALRPRIPASGARPHWGQGICGESFPWVFVVVTVGYAVTLDPAWFRLRLLWGALIAVPLFMWARRDTTKQKPSESNAR